jgi:2-polyprenyl-6-methoxyphenol hydroxylase-like FAD-dependent oxidoreductase
VIHITGMSYKTVLISGTGIAGPTLAFWLARAGFKPTLIECALASILLTRSDELIV